MRQYPETIVEAFSNVTEAEHIRNKFAISNQDHTYKSLIKEIERFAGLFSKLGLSAGDRLLFSVSDDLLKQ